MPEVSRQRRLLVRGGILTAAISTPLMILLMYCAWLPYFMGAYFFILGGLLFGGIWFRRASRARPYPARMVRAAALMLLVYLFAVYMLSEYVVKRGHLVRDVVGASARRLSIETPEALAERYAEAAAHVDRVLAERGPGPVGYWIWVARSGIMPAMPKYGGRPLPPLSQWGFFWAARVIASMVLLAYGMRLQLKELTRSEPAADSTTEDAAGSLGRQEC